MNEEHRKYAQEAYDILSDAAKKIGPRLPGSEGEKKFAQYMSDKLEDIGIKPIKEEFAVTPRSSIGGIPYTGWIGVIMSALVYLALEINALWFPMAFIFVASIVWLICSVFLYKTWFDMFFKQEISQNIYGELLPEDGEYDYTIVLSGHTDTSWSWRHAERTYRYRKGQQWKGMVATFGKMGFGVVCYFLLAAICIFMAVVYGAAAFNAPWALAIVAAKDFAIFQKVLLFLPMVTAFGCAHIIMWADFAPRNASRGAMDNASGIALSYEVTKYFHEHPEKMPKRCRIIDMNVGAEEAGLRGSMAFALEHKGEPILDNTWNINIDSIADEEYFEVVVKDVWQFCHFDKDLEKMFKDTFNEMGIVSKTGGCISNPVGGCDSTPLTRAGMKSVTFAAQNPVTTYYYHTWRDMPERFTVDTIGTGFDVVLGVIDKIEKFQAENGFNGARTK